MATAKHNTMLFWGFCAKTPPVYGLLSTPTASGELFFFKDDYSYYECCLKLSYCEQGESNIPHNKTFLCFIGSGLKWNLHFVFWWIFFVNFVSRILCNGRRDPVLNKQHHTGKVLNSLCAKGFLSVHLKILRCINAWKHNFNWYYIM